MHGFDLGIYTYWMDEGSFVGGLRLRVEGDRLGVSRLPKKKKEEEEERFVNENPMVSPKTAS